MKKNLRIYLLFISLFFAFTTIAQSQDNPIHSVFLVGDAGEPGENPVLTALRKDLDKAGGNSTVIFLGDNIYPKGLPPVGHKLRPLAEEAIDNQINAVKGSKARKVFIPGNHDWAQGRGYGRKWLSIQEQYVEAALDSQDVFLPSRGCPGPVEIDLGEKITLVVIDMQWFLHKGDKPTEGSDYAATGITEAALLLKDILERNMHKKVIVATHHPMYTYGIHGGVFRLKDHLFPLTASKKMSWLYLPLPGLGSIYPLYRKIFGNIQDTTHPVYKQVRNGLVQLMSRHPDIVHVSGHEHALQHIEKEGMHYVVSGSGSKNNAHVKKKGAAQFASNITGFARIDYYADGRTELKFFTPQGQSISEVYSQVISTKPFGVSPQELLEAYPDISFAGKDTVAAASMKYIGKSKFHKRMLGENYRKEWATAIKLPVFDIGTEKGGLKILKRGGGHQTISLRLEAENGRQYVLRSMDKNPGLALPPELRRTFIKWIVQDGISASHPYAPFVVPPLAEAAGIFHANPKVVYIPDDPRFGIYRKDFANTLCLFEERPNDENGVETFFGETDNIISSPDLYEKLRKDNDNTVDQVFVARNRLFDFWLGDWDRHDDQWRWAEYKRKGKGKIYKPIPRDRDQVFFIGEGFFKRLASAKWAQPALRGFEDDLEYVPSMGQYRIRFFDRFFLNEVSLEDWVQQAKELQAGLTDEVIESAVRQWPDKIFQLRGEEVIRKLKSRRDHLHQYAREYYEFLAKNVAVTTSDKREYFKIDRINDQETKITVYKISKKGKRDKVIYERTFKTNETKEVRLFGFDGDDEFEINGDVKKSIKVRIIGGKGDDQIVDNSKVSGVGKKTVVYDTKTDTQLTPGKETSDQRSDKDPLIHEYDMESYKFDFRAPLLSFNYNKDDGIFLGAGRLIRTHSFRKNPYAAFHTIAANYAIATSSYNFQYKGDFVDFLGKADLLVEADIRSPNFAVNFFGLGNETSYDDSRDRNFYRTRFRQMKLNTILKFNWGTKAYLELGPTVETIEIENSRDRFISDFTNNGLNPVNLFERNTYAGGLIGFHFDSRDHPVLPKKGMYFKTRYSRAYGMNDNSENSGKFSGELAFYWSFKEPSRMTMATRVGFEHSMGDFEFFQASFLDGFNNLRGYRRYRFAGETSFYHNLDLRIKLFDWQSYFLPSQVGLLLYNDFGRVWEDGDNSDKMHHGYGAGLWVAPFNRFVISLALAMSEEETLPLVKFGFFF